MPTLCLDVEATLTELLSEEGEVGGGMGERKNRLFLLLSILSKGCLLYTSDAADDIGQV